MVTQAQPARPFIAFDSDPVRTDPGLRLLTPFAQVIDYGLRRDLRISFAGDLPIRRHAWAQLAIGYTVADVDIAIADLLAAGRILIDPVEEVIFIRGWIAGQRGIFNRWSGAIRVARDADKVNNAAMRAEMGAALVAGAHDHLFAVELRKTDSKVGNNAAEVAKAANAGVEWTSIIASLIGTPQEAVMLNTVTAPQAEMVTPDHVSAPHVEALTAPGVSVPEPGPVPTETVTPNTEVHAATLADTLTDEFLAMVRATGKDLAPETQDEMRSEITVELNKHDEDTVRRAMQRHSQRIPTKPKYFSGSVKDVIENPGIEDAGGVDVYDYAKQSKRTGAAASVRPPSRMLTSATVPANA
jgi:hypothetical protein